MAKKTNDNKPSSGLSESEKRFVMDIAMHDGQVPAKPQPKARTLKEGKKPLKLEPKKVRLFAIVAASVIALLVIVVSIASVTNNGNAVAKIGGRIVSKEDYEAYLKALKSFQKRLGGNSKLSPEQEALQKLVMLRALENEAAKRGIKVTDAEVKKKLNDSTKQYGGADSVIGQSSGDDGMSSQVITTNYKIQVLQDKLKDNLLSFKDVLAIQTRYDLGVGNDEALAKGKLESEYLPMLRGKASSSSILQKAEFGDGHSEEEQKAIALSPTTVLAVYKRDINQAAMPNRFTGQADWQAIASLRNVGDYTPAVVRSDGGYFVLYRLEKISDGKYATWEEYQQDIYKQAKIYSYTTKENKRLTLFNKEMCRPTDKVSFIDSLKALFVANALTCSSGHLGGFYGHVATTSGMTPDAVRIDVGPRDGGGYGPNDYCAGVGGKLYATYYTDAVGNWGTEKAFSCLGNSGLRWKATFSKPGCNPVEIPLKLYNGQNGDIVNNGNDIVMDCVPPRLPANGWAQFVPQVADPPFSNKNIYNGEQCVIGGWAFDAEAPTTRGPQVDVYFDSSAYDSIVPDTVLSAKAENFWPGVSADPWVRGYGPAPDDKAADKGYGFFVKVPDKYRDGAPHTAYVYSHRVDLRRDAPFELNYNLVANIAGGAAPIRFSCPPSTSSFRPWLQTTQGNVVSQNKITGQPSGGNGGRDSASPAKEAEFVVISRVSGTSFCSSNAYALGSDQFNGAWNCNIGTYQINTKYVESSSVYSNVESTFNLSKTASCINTNPSNGVLSGSSASSPTVLPGGDISGGCDKGKIYQLNDNAYIAKSSFNRGRATVFSKGNLHITGDITVSGAGPYEGEWLPNLGIVVDGDVVIAAGVKRLDAAIFATGTIKTCDDDYTKPAGGVSCTEKLDVHGLLASGNSSKSFSFGRRHVKTDGGPGEPAESIIYQGKILGFPPPGFTITRNKLKEQIKYESGLPPRF